MNEDKMYKDMSKDSKPPQCKRARNLSYETESEDEDEVHEPAPRKLPALAEEVHEPAPCSGRGQGP